MAPTVSKKASNHQKPAPRKPMGKPVEKETSDFDEWRKAKQLLKPKDQLELPEAELKEILARVLMTTNPQKPEALVEFSYKEGRFIDVPPPGNLVVAYRLEGSQIHIDTDEATNQLIEMGYDPEEYRAQAREGIEEEVIEEAIPEETEEVQEEEAAAEETEKPEGDEEDEEAAAPPKEAEEEEHGEGDEDEAEVAEKPAEAPKGRKKKLTNQFNFCERASLTYNLPVRSQEIQTIPPPRANFSALVLQWVIYDAYQKDFEAQELEKELEKERKEKEKAMVSTKPKPIRKKPGKAQISEAVKMRIAEAWKVLERMINQNTFYDIAKDYRYWEDPADEFREEEGTLLPLWKFTYDKVRKNTVTDIEWNPYYYDLFAVTFGYLDFVKPVKEGAVCVYTLKNPSFPDYICITHCACMCISSHPKFPYMLAVGLIDGSVFVYNIQQTCKEPVYTSNIVTNKHRGIVWEVKWAPDLPDGELNFFSIASDGKINNWVLMQSDLAHTTVFTLYLPMDPVAGPDGTFMKMRGSACCVAFHPKDPLIYLVGTETGSIYECSTAYSSIYLFVYEAHHMPIYRIDFNRYNTEIFASCSADWRIKIWEHKRDEPLFVFDVGAAVNDVKWAPYSSTVFASVTVIGKVFVFDINVNKYKPICEQAVVSRRRNKLARLAFNYKLPIIIVGDDKGCVTTLKLSPNLRIMCKPPKKQQYLDQFTLQCMKLEKLLALVREPVTLTPPPDTAGTEE
ncbi:dynein intermediate chain 2, ciliary [Harmonia axyridis]|uniref:dynein intermediate chain 2, ciliary n=1 Tax=Harmonia axyridis TaxID=115357 RepID=UPI001E278B20|nr:dynein intermediate chain 2, ciliary [Harmonia axyridis]